MWLFAVGIWSKVVFGVSFRAIYAEGYLDLKSKVVDAETKGGIVFSYLLTSSSRLSQTPTKLRVVQYFSEFRAMTATYINSRYIPLFVTHLFLVPVLACEPTNQKAFNTEKNTRRED